jgi:hypothetical protein
MNTEQDYSSIPKPMNLIGVKNNTQNKSFHVQGSKGAPPCLFHMHKYSKCFEVYYSIHVRLAGIQDSNFQICILMIPQSFTWHWKN